MDLQQITTTALEPALEFLPPEMDSPEARVQVLATGLQESRFKYRFQKLVGQPFLKGPAKGFWQFERGGGVAGVLEDESTSKLAEIVCLARNVTPDVRSVWSALEDDDVLAAAFARLLIWSDPEPLPDLGDAEGAWELYLRLWRPGKPHRDSWDAFYQQALTEVFP